MTRRVFLAAIGGGLAATGLATWTFGGWTTGTTPVLPDDQPCCDYTDHEGWVVTVEDRQALAPGGGLRPLAQTDLQGPDIATGVRDSADECEYWCASEPACRGYSYTSAAHPQAVRRSVCHLKGENQLPQVFDAFSTAGVR